MARRFGAGIEMLMNSRPAGNKHCRLSIHFDDSSPRRLRKEYAEFLRPGRT